MRFFHIGCFIIATLALSTGFATQLERSKFMTALLEQPLPKIRDCAKQGLVAYQNTLSLVYLDDQRSDHDADKVKAYTWAYLALYQLKHRDKQNFLIQQQAEFVTAISKQLTDHEIRRAKHLAQTYYELYGKHWPKVPVMRNESFPSQCKLELLEKHA
ncbi:MAG: hypothetical protein COV52_03885 [Gammaproteobacteria bacterium CG11_big_fil_rev_8_21_14_0_20_46_22]|nr:MAG: hypothetical protein COW05_01935 [Gammaproteobacteria bacterium CG12_big_fil_rev_8_21_14_0_65_46_12]PIR11461.1 MAG: hypothetical protein COV52_03885 [Gammaproteobacteria bacterium CG11_big_fil_rev_8_21_14_0_20_46_22]